MTDPVDVFVERLTRGRLTPDEKWALECEFCDVMTSANYFVTEDIVSSLKKVRFIRDESIPMKLTMLTHLANAVIYNSALFHLPSTTKCTEVRTPEDVQESFNEFFGLLTSGKIEPTMSDVVDLRVGASYACFKKIGDPKSELEALRVDTTNSSHRGFLLREYTLALIQRRRLQDGRSFLRGTNLLDEILFAEGHLFPRDVALGIPSDKESMLMTACRIHCLLTAANVHKCGIMRVVLDGFAHRLLDASEVDTRAQMEWLDAIIEALAVVIDSDPFTIPDHYGGWSIVHAWLAKMKIPAFTWNRAPKCQSVVSPAVKKCVAAAISNVKKRLVEEYRIEKRRAKKNGRKLRKESRATMEEPDDTQDVDEPDDSSLPPVETLLIDTAPMPGDTRASSSGIECAICFEVATRRGLLSCGCAKICLDCCYEALEREHTCPTCRAPDVVIDRAIFI